MREGGINMKRPKYHVVGSSHFDLAWKKGEQEFGEILDVFVIRLLDTLENNPEFTYVLEQAYHFRSLHERRPDLIQRLRKYVQEGRLEFVGGLASTLDTNLPNGESFVRNQLIGMKWIAEHFGVEVRTGWLIDTFGLNAQIPQILSQFGIRHLMANRFGGTKYHDVFMDKGLDGTEIMVVGKDVYAPFVKPGHLFFGFVQSWEDTDALFEAVRAKRGTGPIMVMPYTENEVYVSHRFVHQVDNQRSEGRAEDWAFAIPADFFEALEETGENFPVENGDLNPEFTATFCLRIHIRTRNRRVENLLLEAEKWAVLQKAVGFSDSVEKAWWLMAFNHFHDIFSGSHPTKVYLEAMDYFDRVEETASQLLNKVALTAHDREAECRTEHAAADHYVFNVFNGLPFDRMDILELPFDADGMGVEKVICNGCERPFEVLGGHVRIVADLSATSINVVEVRKGKNGLVRQVPVDTGRTDPDVSSEKYQPDLDKESVPGRIENEYILLECDNQTGLKRLVWKPTGKVLLENAEDFLVIQQDMGSFQIESPCGSEMTAGAGTFQVSLYESSPVCSRISLGGVFPAMAWAGPDSHLEWEAEFTLVPGKPVLYVKLHVNWKGEASRIRLKLSTTLTASEGFYEIPFGVVNRKPYAPRGTARGEWPAHRFATVENAEYGLALINTGVPGVEIAGGTIWTTMLRAPKAEYAGMNPDDTSSQHGAHPFDFALVPYQGNWEESGVVRFAQELNNPLLPVSIPHGETRQPSGTPLLCLEPASLVLSTVKAPEDGSDEVVVRVYETTGKNVCGSLWMVDAETAWDSDLKEKRLEAMTCENGQIQVVMKPFEIKTIRVRRHQ